ncbi:MAG: uroporphyrinogen decarboxylase family protein [Candidatus Omnitrophica bacterium]|nr:uroporphyrinogen decarboxylase family protein [Candidatus Omnitrophota bacterium]
MSQRENYTRILKKEKGEFLPFVPNFDHWYNINQTQGTLPEKYQGLSRNDIVRKVQGTIWARTRCLDVEIDSTVEIIRQEKNGTITTDYHTPVGSVQTVHRRATDFTQAVFLKSHWVKTVNDIRVVRWIVEHTHFTLNVQPFLESERAVGDDGLSLVGLPYCLPYIHFGKNECGWEHGIYLFTDYRPKVEELLELYTVKVEEAARLLAQGPALVIASGDNMDEWTTPPNIFRQYAIPYYQRIAAILHSGGKVFQVHWCGRTSHLLEFVPECDIDVVEAIAVKPMAELTVPEAMAKVGEKVVIQGGLPSILFCPQGGTREDFRLYVKALLEKVPHGYRFALGMSDNVPPDADFSRVEMVGELVASFGSTEK